MVSRMVRWRGSVREPDESNRNAWSSRDAIWSRRQDFHPRRGQLDGQRDAVQALADVRDR